MQIRAPKWLEPAAALVTAPLWVPFVVAFGVLASAVWLKRSVMGPTKGWQRWFAWFPVNVGRSSWPSDRDWRWLEVVERRSDGLLMDNQYREVA